MGLRKILDDKDVVKLYPGDALDWDEPELVAVDVQMEGESMKYNVYRMRYTKALNKGNVTDSCLEYVYIDKLVDIKTYDNDGDNVLDKAHLIAADKTEITELDTVNGKLNIYVATQGVQAQGFEAEGQKAAYKVALDSAFPNHPWAE